MKKRHDLALLTALLAGGLNALVGFVVLFGWYTHNLRILHLHPGYVAMAYNTALGIFLGGIGLLAIALRRPYFALVGGVYSVLCGSLTLGEYLFHCDLRIDELFMRAYTITGVTNNARMAFSTALCILLSGIFQILCVRRIKSSWLLWFSAVIGSLIIGLSVVALTGYFIGIQHYYAWGTFTRMALHTALSFILLGMGILAYTRHCSRGVACLALRWLPIPLGVGVICLSVSLWQALIVEQGIQLEWLHHLVREDALPKSLILMNTVVPQAALLIGIIVALLLASLVSVAQTNQQRALRIGYVNQELNTEVRVRQEAEEAWRVNAERLRLATDAGGVAVWEYHIPSWTLTWDERMMTLYGFTAETFPGAYEAWSLRLHPDDKARAEAELQDAITYQTKFDTEFRIVLPDGTIQFIKAMATVFNDENGLPNRMIGLNQNITERKFMESQLGHAQKMQSIGQLAAGIAHEINTPTQYIGDNIRFVTEAFEELAVVLQATRDVAVASKAGTVPAELGARLETLIEQGDTAYLLAEIPLALQQSADGINRVAKIVQAMKEFSHPGNTEKVAVDINRALESTLTVARTEWKYVAEVVTEFDATLPPVPCLPGEFNQVILNLVINAAHAIAEAGRRNKDAVSGKKDVGGVITVRTLLAEEWVEIHISDTGTGIPEAIRAHIFDPFFTTKEVGKGTGQGLAIAHSIMVDKHGGTIHFETETDCGTTFILRLPLGEAPLRGRTLSTGNPRT